MADAAAIRVVLADDHALFRAGLRAVLERGARYRVVGEAGNGEEAVRLARELSPEVTLMDLTMPGLNGTEAIHRIKAEGLGTKVIMVTGHSDRQFVREAFRAGAVGYVPKSSLAVELEMAMEAALRDEMYVSPKVAAGLVQGPLHPSEEASAYGVLSARERQVLQLVAEGRTNKEMAKELGISAKTVEVHRAQVMGKLDIHTVAGLTKYAIRHGLTSVEG